jgi:hypothetical protein
VKGASTNITGTNYTWDNIKEEYCIASNNLISRKIYEGEPYNSPLFSDGAPEVSKIVAASLLDADT